MGDSGGRGGHQHHDRRFPAKVQERAGTSHGPSSRIIHGGSSNSPPGDVCSEVVKKGSNKGNKEKNSS